MNHNKKLNFSSKCVHSGIEKVDDIIADLDQALEKVKESILPLMEHK